MRCRSCNYALWNLTTRQCPECGTAFLPSEFEFTPGSVRFHCPHCSKAYYGTDEKGHLVPRAFTCVGCGRAIEMDEMALSPAAGVQESQTVALEVPWVNRKEKGRIQAFFRTVWWAISRPGDLGRSIPVVGGSVAAWLFMMIAQLLAWGTHVLSYIVLSLVFLVPAMVAAGGGGGRGGAAVGAMVAGMSIFVMIPAAITALLLVPLWGLVAHALLRATGPTRGPRSLSFSALCYSGGANALTGVPFIGYFIGPVWWLVSATLALKEAQRVSGGRAALAVLPLPILGTILLVVGYVGVVGWSMSMAASAATTAARAAAQKATDAARASQLVVGIMNAGVRGDGEVPHPVRLVAGQRIPLQSLVWDAGNTRVESWNIGGATLTDIPLLAADELQLVEDRIIRAETESGAAETRVADVVFLYRGVDVSASDPGLWLFVIWPDPGANAMEDPGWTIRAGRIDGSVAEYTPAAFDAALAEQNLLRSGAGLPRVRHPRDVR